MKKKLLAGLLTVFMLVGLFPALGMAESPFAGGGTEGNPYQIATAEQLDLVRDYLTSYFVLVADIDLTNYTYADGWYGWRPIGGWVGSTAVPFTGSFNGNGHTIRGLYINRSDSDIGLFGITQGAVITNVALEDVNVRGERWVGGLVGYASGTVITGSSVTGAVTATRFSAGGLVGFLANSSLISQSSSAATVVSQGISYYPEDEGTGGLVGQSNGSQIFSSYATGIVSGERYVGGLVGYGYISRVEYSYATGAVSGKDKVGGLMGYAISTMVKDSYAIGSVTLTDAGSAGGLVGSGLPDVIASYYNTETTGQEGDDARGQPRTTADMTHPHNENTTYYLWDFDETWGIDGNFNAGYPFLLWEITTNNYLSDLTVAEAVLNPSFEPKTLVYEVVVSSQTTSIDITATLADTNAILTINGNDCTSGEIWTMELQTNSENVANIVVTNDGYSRTYKITFTWEPSSDKPDKPDKGNKPDKEDKPDKPDNPPGKPENPGKPPKKK